MHCPFCQTPSQEDAPECPRCGFSLPKLDAIFGEPPVVTKRLTDEEGLLPPAERKRLGVSIERFQQRFPQVGFHFWIGPVDGKVPVHLWMFWLFNRGNLPTRGGVSSVNREILLGIDSKNRRAVIVTGYGLEPFLGHRHLTEIIEKAKVELASGLWLRAGLTVIEQLSDVLAQLHGAMRQTYGAVPQELGVAPETRGY